MTFSWVVWLKKEICRLYSSTLCSTITGVVASNTLLWNMSIRLRIWMMTKLIRQKFKECKFLIDVLRQLVSVQNCSKYILSWYDIWFELQLVPTWYTNHRLLPNCFSLKWQSLEYTHSTTRTLHFNLHLLQLGDIVHYTPWIAWKIHNIIRL